MKGINVKHQIFPPSFSVFLLLKSNRKRQKVAEGGGGEGIRNLLSIKDDAEWIKNIRSIIHQFTYAYYLRINGWRSALYKKGEENKHLNNATYSDELNSSESNEVPRGDSTSNLITESSHGKSVKTSDQKR